MAGGQSDFSIIETFTTTRSAGLNSPVVQKSFDVVCMSAFLTYCNIQVNIQSVDNKNFETKEGYIFSISENFERRVHSTSVGVLKKL